jgi:hypothetical protein
LYRKQSFWDTVLQFRPTGWTVVSRAFGNAMRRSPWFTDPNRAQTGVFKCAPSVKG